MTKIRQSLLTAATALSLCSLPLYASTPDSSEIWILGINTGEYAVGISCNTVHDAKKMFQVASVRDSVALEQLVMSNKCALHQSGERVFVTGFDGNYVQYRFGSSADKYWAHLFMFAKSSANVAEKYYRGPDYD